MKLGLTLPVGGAHPRLDMDLILEAESLGYDSVWTGEAYGTDAVTPAAWVLARTTKIKAGTGIMQMSARTPTCVAMTAMTLQALSGNRFLCGVGPSGPQVIEGWHGQPFGKPVDRTREYVAIIRQILAREKPLTFDGEYYQIPYKGPGASGLAKPLRSMTHGNPDMKFYTASITPGGLRVSGEVADGNIPIFMSPEKADLMCKTVLDGMAKAGRAVSLADYDVAPHVKVRVGTDLQALRDSCKPEYALYIGGMGARGKNYYNDYAKRLGYEAEAIQIQDLYLDGKKDAAAALVPDKLVDELALIGPKERIRDRLAAWKEAGREGKVGTMILTGATRESIRTVAEAIL
jgi:F420-dependent oxidoreductase-like protein